MRKTIFAEGEYYHIFNRGSKKQLLFLDTRDYIRFLFLILHTQSPIVFTNLGRQVNHYLAHNSFHISKKERGDIISSREVTLHAFCLMPNHFHLILSGQSPESIPRFLHRIQTGYGMYFNTRYHMSGHVFQGAFRSVHIENNEQLLYLSAYIHKNPLKLLQKKKNKDLREYPWSSYRDFVQESRWGQLLIPDLIRDQFLSPQEYEEFIKTSPAKELLEAEPLTILS